MSKILSADVKESIVSIPNEKISDLQNPYIHIIAFIAYIFLCTVIVIPWALVL